MKRYLVTCAVETNSDGTPYSIEVRAPDAREARRQAEAMACVYDHEIEEVR